MVATNILLIIYPKTSLHPTLQNLSPEYSLQVQQTLLDGHMPEFLENPSPKLAVVDASKNSAWEGLARAKAFRQIHNTFPIILLTKEGSEDFAQPVLRAGINDYLKEPFGLSARLFL